MLMYYWFRLFFLLHQNNDFQKDCGGERELRLANQYHKSGGYSQATKDFDELVLKDVKNIPNGKDGKRTHGKCQVKNF